MFSDDGEAAAAELNAIPMSDNAWNMTYSNSKNINSNDSNNNYLGGAAVIFFSGGGCCGNLFGKICKQADVNVCVMWVCYLPLLTANPH